MIKSAGQRQEGFTLMEIMIALVLICLVVVSVIELSSANWRNLAKSDDCIEALTNANDKMRDVLELEEMEEKSWTETDKDGCVYDIATTEIEKERSQALAVKFMHITVKASHANKSGANTVSVRTAKMISRSDALNDVGKDGTRKGYEN
ncbi:MAG: prepilin-type N-terminal cleavage/methylation domain-containing protein [Deltaproteobacteria bacterium]